MLASFLESTPAPKAMCMQAEDADNERDEDEGSLAAFGCLGALSTVLESVSSLPHLFPSLEPVVFPILQKLCTQEGQDVYEEVMEILSFFTFFSPEVPPLVPLFPTPGNPREHTSILRISLMHLWSPFLLSIDFCKTRHLVFPLSFMKAQAG